MSNFDHKLRELLSDNESVSAFPAAEENYYREVMASFRGEGSELGVLTWVGILIFSAGLIYCVIRMLLATSVEEQVLFGVFAVMLNSAQIALKLWFNMRLNRRAIIREIRNLQLQLAGPID
ncbi:MAG: DUF6768 family protein [Woeseia sp.]